MSSDDLRRSWIANADAWRDAVREQRIESRRLGTDAAVVRAVLEQMPRSVLDLGCGEGWLTRALTAEGIEAMGVDASPGLIAAAQELGGGTFRVLAYDELASLGATFDVVVANFALLEESLPLDAIRTIGRTLVVQTVHPAFIAGDYEDGWRVETFASMPGSWNEPMPWYFRTLGSWVRLFGECGFTVRELREPLHPEKRTPLSIVFVCD